MRIFGFLAALILSAGMGQAQCGGSFAVFVDGLKSEAVAKGHAADKVEAFFAGVRQDGKVLKADRAQGVFQMAFTDFARRLISTGRFNKGRSMAQKYDSVFDEIETRYGVSRGVLLAFWAFETDYGGYQAISTRVMRWLRWRMIVADQSCFARRYSRRLSCSRRAIFRLRGRPGPGPEKSAWFRCCRATFLKTASMAMAMGMSG